MRTKAVAKGHKKRGAKADTSPKAKTVVQSRTDPERGVLKRPGNPGGFYYLNHQSVDGKSGIITDVHITPANTEDFEPYVNRIRNQFRRYKFDIQEVGIDSGYDYEEIHKELYDMGIRVYVPLRDMEKNTAAKIYPPSAFAFDSAKDAYVCPNGCELRYSSVNKSQRKKVYRASQQNCKNCPVKEQCIGGNLKCRTIKVSFSKKSSTANMLTATPIGILRYSENGKCFARGILPFKKTIAI